VINKSSQTFTEAELILLNKGLNFAIKPKIMPLMEVIASFESGIQKLTDKVKTDYRIRHIKKITKLEISKSNFSNDSNSSTEIKRL
jgi:hypothetical protein